MIPSRPEPTSRVVRRVDRPRRLDDGFALITVVSLVGVLALLLTAMFVASTVEISSTESSVGASTGFFSAEAGLNLRGDAVAQIFEDYRVPQGAAPSSDAPCREGDVGSGDFACETYRLNGREVVTYTVEDPANTATGGRAISIPSDETFGGLIAFENRYTVASEALNPRTERPEARLEMVFRSRLVPVFQFAAFYDKDLEILPGPSMDLNGRVHVNGDLYLNSSNRLAIEGPITVAAGADGEGGELIRGRLDNGACGGTVRVDDADVATDPDPRLECSGAVPQDALDAWNGQIETGLDTLRVPEVESFEVGEDNLYWSRADLRIVLNADSGRVYVSDGRVAGGRPQVDATASAALLGCSSGPSTVPFTPTGTTASGAPLPAGAVVNASRSFYDNREGSPITMLEVDVAELLRCIQDENNALLGGRDIDKTDLGGLVVYLSVVDGDPGNDDTPTPYGVRVRNGADLASPDPAHPDIAGLTLVTDRAAYVEGDYNCDAICNDATSGAADWRPASILADALNLLSGAWSDDGASTGALGRRRATDTEINAAFLAGTDVTGSGRYNGGLENYPRFHENWSARTLRYRGSLVSFGSPVRSDGRWKYGSPVYTAPERDWDYDRRFNDPRRLPPLSPRFVYLRQELFVREFER